MSILKIARIGHPVLHKESSPVDNIEDPSIKQLIQDMTETMLDANGVGLAAPQVHCSKQIMIFRIPETDKEGNETIESKQIKIMALINPKILQFSKETENHWEGCLSIPGMLGLVKRFSKISYEGLDLNGNIIRQEAEGLHARIFQHEFDHLKGIVYTHRLVDHKAYGFVEEIEEYWKKNHDEN